MDGISVVEYIKSHKIKAVEEIDLEKSTIKYSNFIKNSSRISKITGEEELVRAFLVTKFVNELDYKLENIEFEKEYNIGRPKVKKARIDIILRDITGNPFLFIELKSPSEYEKEKEEAIKGQLYQLAFLEEKEFNTKIKYLVYYTYDAQNEDLRDLATIIDFSKFHNYDAWEEALYPSVSDEIPARYEKAQKEPYKKGSKRDLETNFSPETLNALRTNLHDVLWGGGGTDDNEIFSSLVNIILAKIEDESDKTNGQEYEFQVYSYGKGDQEELENNEDLYDRINDLYRRALKKRLNVEERLVTKANIINEEKFSLNKLRYTVQQLERFSFVDGKNSYNGKDILGDFFEGIIRDGFKQTKGQFFTPPPIVTFLLYALELDNLAIDKLNNNSDLPYIIDPSAGSGTFLIEAMKFVTDIIKYKRKNDLKDSRDVEDKFHEYFMPDHRENKWAREFIYGSEINFNLGTATKVNMILHGDGSTNIFVKDGLSPFKMFVKESAPNFLNKYINDDLYHNKEVNKEFDAVISNPPFSVSLDKETQKHLNKEFLFSKKKNSENLFIERWYQLLRENGRFGVVLPESVFDTTENKYIRLFLYKYFKIKAVVSLPQVTFEPYTSTKTSLLFAQKKTSKEIEKWNEVWTKYSNDYSKLKTRIENYLKVYIEGKDKSKYPSIKDDNDDTIKSNLFKLLKNFVDENDKKLPIKELIEKYKEEIIDLLKFDNDLVDYFGHVNIWWVFGEVSKETDYDIFMAEVENVGYKRTKRGEKSMPNELFQVNEQGEIVIDTQNPKTALDYLRKQVKWD